MNPAVASVISTQWPDPQPAAVGLADPREVTLPGVDARWRFGWQYWSATLRSALGRHRLCADACGRYRANVALPAALRERWAELFDLRRGPEGVDYPFLHALPAITLLQARVFADLQVNTRHVQPLRHGTRLAVVCREFAAAGEQQLHCELRRVVRVGPTEVLAILVTRIEDAGGKTLAQVDDSFVVQGLDLACAAQADEDDAVRRSVSRLRRRSPEIDPLDGEVRTRQLYLAPSAIRRFGRVGGDHEPALSRLLPGALRRRRPVVQGQYLRHLVVRELAEWGVEPRDLQLVHTARAQVGQTLRLMELRRRFELVDEIGRLVAYGKA